MATNVLLLLTPKAQLVYLDDSMSVRQAMEKMKAHRYSAIPMISKDEGLYLGSLSEGDLLWHLYSEKEGIRREELEKESAENLLRKNFMPAMRIDASLQDVFRAVLNQNYVPVTDDRGVLVGIVTRKAVIREILNRLPSAEKGE